MKLQLNALKLKVGNKKLLLALATVLLLTGCASVSRESAESKYVTSADADQCAMELMEGKGPSGPGCLVVGRVYWAVTE